jgi:hypothetical protein
VFNSHQAVHAPPVGGFRRHAVGPFEAVVRHLGELAEAGARHGLLQVGPGVLGHAAEERLHFLVAPGLHRVGQFVRPLRRRRFEADRVGEESVDAVHQPNLKRTPNPPRG